MSAEPLGTEGEHMDLKYQDRWEVIGDPLGEGGQGKVFLVRGSDKVRSGGKLVDLARHAVVHLNSPLEDVRRNALDQFRDVILEITQSERPENLGALKVLHEPKDARDHERAEERIKREMKVMSKMTHSNLLKILDSDPNGKWFVSQYHPNGVLSEHLGSFKGNAAAALRTFRPLVDAVAKLHAESIVHRDIKPHNVFLAKDTELILGDFGLIFFTDDQHTRLSATLENVGSRDWMPPWAMGRIEKIDPSFDVFSLGKLLWSMVSGQSFLRLWYFHKTEFNVEKSFPDVPAMRFVNELLAKCVVEEKDDCLPNATALLGVVDATLLKIESHAEVLGDDIQRKCRAFGTGNYDLIVDRGPSATKHFGMSPTGVRCFKIFTCHHCGHVQLFAFPTQEPLPAWNN